MTHIFVINEISIFRFLWFGLLGKNVFVLSIEPWFSPIRKLLQWAVDWSLKMKWARDAIELCPQYKSIRGIYAEVYIYNIFGQTEQWQNKNFSFNLADEKVLPYAMAYKHLTCNYMAPKHLGILILKDAIPKFREKGVSIWGLLPSSEGTLSELTGDNFNREIRRNFLFLFPIINILNFCVLTLYSWIWIGLRIRPFMLTKKKYFLAADYHGDLRDLNIYECAKAAGDVLLVQRGQMITPEQRAPLKLYPSCSSNNGRMTLSEGFKSIAFVLLDSLCLTRHFLTNEPAHFFQVILLPHRRAVLRAFFSRFDVQNFWGRDEYNVEHILRRQEINRIGGKSIGILHSLPTYCDHFPQWRYANFDRYYVFGRKVLEQHRDTWAPDMEVVPAGSFGMSRRDYADMGKSRSNDIAVFAGIYTNQESLVVYIRNLAMAFPDRTVWLQIKSNYEAIEQGQNFIAACCDSLPNIKHTSEPIFDIFRKIRYCFSDPSTIVVEAMQFGLNSFMTDVSSIHEECVYRDYKDLCIKTPHEAANRIKAIESGAWKYPVETYEELVDLSGTVIFDRILNGFGIDPASTPLQPSILEKI